MNRREFTLKSRKYEKLLTMFYLKRKYFLYFMEIKSPNRSFDSALIALFNFFLVKCHQMKRLSAYRHSAHHPLTNSRHFPTKLSVLSSQTQKQRCRVHQSPSIDLHLIHLGTVLRLPREDSVHRRIVKKPPPWSGLTVDLIVKWAANFKVAGDDAHPATRS